MSSAIKRARKTQDYDFIDRLSDLPDEVLCHILSFLNTKYAVATSVLSTRWKNLSLSLPNIVLDDSLTRRRRNKKVMLEFAKFGLRQIMIRDVPHINQFHLTCEYHFKDPAIQTLICAAIWRNVKEINICLSKREVTRILPPEVFTSKSLVVLKLRGFMMQLDVPGLVSLPNVKVMMLGDFILPSDDSLRRLFRGCKNLEDLSLSNCDFWLLEVLHLSLPLLKKLSFNHPRSIVETKLVIDTPNLEFLEYQGFVAKFNVVKKLKSLSGARISFVAAPELKSPFVEDHRKNVSEFVNKLLGVKYLYLAIGTLEAICPGCFSLHVFESLTFLELGAFNHRILPIILESTPQLQELVIPTHVESKGNDPRESMCSLPETVPMCLVKHLKKIKFTHFLVLECEFQLVKYFLQNGKVLERMKIARLGLGTWRTDVPPSVDSVRKKISMFTKCSEMCDIVFD